MPPKSAKLQHYSLSQKKQRKILQRFYPKYNFFYTNIVGMFLHLLIQAGRAEEEEGEEPL